MSTKSHVFVWARSAICAASLFATSASAIPVLQLYIEGASYDAQEESWYVPSTTFRLWTIANLTGPGGTQGLPIVNVRLAAVYDDPGIPVSITLTPTIIGGTGEYRGFTDPSTPGLPVWLQTVSDGSTPLIGGNRYLPPHGEFGSGRTWQEFALGDFTTADSQIADFIHVFPTPSAGYSAQINAYDVKVEGSFAHFDLYGEVIHANGRVSYIHAPFSHDATDGPSDVPLPATLALLGIGGIGLAACRRKRALSSTPEAG
jgi:hypothetical protein